MVSELETYTFRIRNLGFGARILGFGTRNLTETFFPSRKGVDTRL